MIDFHTAVMDRSGAGLRGRSAHSYAPVVFDLGAVMAVATLVLVVATLAAFTAMLAWLTHD